MSVLVSVQIDPKMQDLINGLKNVDRTVRAQAWDDTRRMALDMEQNVKMDIPVDTGRAKASWGHFTPEDLTGGASRIGKGTRITKRTKFKTAPGRGGVQIANAGDAIWEEDPANLQVIQGTHVPYVAFLNDGTSKMAPLGFIDRALERASNTLGVFAQNLIDRIEATLFSNQGLGI